MADQKVVKVVDYADQKWTDVFHVAEAEYNRALKVAGRRKEVKDNMVILDADKLGAEKTNEVLNIIQHGVTVKSGRVLDPEHDCDMIIRVY